MASVRLERVSRVYPGQVVGVDRLDLEVKDQELLVLVGPSGCGKSTTLRLIAGLEPISSGDIWIGSRRVNDVAPKDRDIAMVFQNYALYPHMSVYRNLSFGLELRAGGGWLNRLRLRLMRPTLARQAATLRTGISARVTAAARVLGIEGLLDRMPGQLSGGERQRVALGRAIVREPEVFLFDEPLSNLDAQLRVEMRRELKRLHQRLSTTMIYVTHDQVEAMTLGDRVAVMRDGVLLQLAAPEEIYARPVNRFVAGFIGSPTMNFIEGTLTHADADWQIDAGGWTVPVDSVLGERVKRWVGQRVVLGVRPERVKSSKVAPSSEVAAGGAPQRSSLIGTVTTLEPLGDTTIVHLAIAGSGSGSGEPTDEGTVLVSKMPAAERAAGARIGERRRISIDTSAAHLFDVQTGENLSDEGAEHRDL